TGRFTAPDPLQLLAPNVYAYAANNPLTFIDPSGLEPGRSVGHGLKSIGQALHDRQEILTNPGTSDGEIVDDPTAPGQEINDASREINRGLADKLLDFHPATADPEDHGTSVDFLDEIIQDARGDGGLSPEPNVWDDLVDLYHWVTDFADKLWEY